MYFKELGNLDKRMTKLKLHNSVFTSELENEAREILGELEKVVIVFEECRNFNNKEIILSKCRYYSLLQNDINKQI